MHSRYLNRFYAPDRRFCRSEVGQATTRIVFVSVLLLTFLDPAATATLEPGQVIPREKPSGRVVTLDTKPERVTFDTAKTAVIVVDMQNDFGAKGGMFDRAGIDIVGIQHAVGPTARVLAAARESGIKIIYLKMGYRPADLDDRLKSMGKKHLIFTGCTTSVCVDSTVREAMYRDYSCVLLADCMSEPIKLGLAESSHDRSLLTAELRFGWVADSGRFVSALQP